MKLSRALFFVALVTALILMVPYIAMQFTSEVDWDLRDFVLMGALIFTTGTLLAVALRMSFHLVYRVAMGVVILSTFFLIWVNLAVGLIGSGPNPGNLMYIGIVALILIGIYLSRYKAAALERAMYVVALAFLLLAAIGLLVGMQSYPGSSVTEVIAINLFFATPYLVAGFLFRHVVIQQLSDKHSS